MLHSRPMPVWRLTWYFRRSWWLPLKLALFAYLLYGLAYHIFYSGLRALAVIKVMWAIPAGINKLFALIVLFSVTPATVPIMLSPAAIFGAQLLSIPEWWSVPSWSWVKSAGMTLVVLVVCYYGAVLAGTIGLTLLGWIVDINPCVALAAGVTGSHPPDNCP